MCDHLGGGPCGVSPSNQVLARVLVPTTDMIAPAFAGAASEAGKNAGAIMSVVGTNTLANTWFDGETPHGPPPRWSHIWEQGYGDLATLEEHGSSTGADFLHEQGVERFIELRYEVLEPD